MPILLLVGACSTAQEEEIDNATTQNNVVPDKVTLHTGTFDVGPHGPVFSTDEEWAAAMAKAKGGPAETSGMLIMVEETARPEFRRVLAKAISKGVQAGIPEYGMRLRVALEGAPETLPIVSDGFTQQFRVHRIVAIEPCPKEPANKNGCSNYR